MTAKSILEELRPLGSDSYKRVMGEHGVREPFFGVKISELQKIVKRIKKDHSLALALYDTGNYDAMYLAGLIADDEKMTRKDLQRWVEKTVHRSPDLVRYQMNSFLISVGSYVRPLTETALQVGEAIGPVTADLGDTSCQVPFAPDYIRKVEKRGSLGKKRKTVKC